MATTGSSGKSPGLDYWPHAYPDETLGSIIARWGSREGIKCGDDVAAAVAGVPQFRHSCLHAWLSSFCTHLQDRLGIDTAKLLWETTMIPYYYAFSPPEERDALLHWHGDGDDQSPGVSASLLFGLPRPLVRYCPVCAEEETSRYGECYVHISHQLPLSFTCHTHDQLLQLVLTSNVWFRPLSSALSGRERLTPLTDVPAASCPTCTSLIGMWSHELATRQLGPFDPAVLRGIYRPFAEKSLPGHRSGRGPLPINPLSDNIVRSLKSILGDEAKYGDVWETSPEPWQWKMFFAWMLSAVNDQLEPDIGAHLRFWLAAQIDPTTLPQLRVLG